MPRSNKPILIKIGKHYISPDNISGIKCANAKKGLYILQTKDQPEPEFPLWLSGKELQMALPFFDVQG